MSRTSSTFVSPNLAPTSDWGQQTSTGVFRPPPVLQLQPSNVAGSSNAAVDRHFDSRQSYLLPATTAQTAREQGAEASGDASMDFGGGAERTVGGPAGSSFVTPMMGPTSTPFSQGPSSPPTLRSLVPLPASPHDSLPVLMKMIRYAIHAEQDVFLSQKEANRLLEGELQREQEQRKATNEQLATLTRSIATLREIAKEQKEILAKLKPAEPVSS